MHKCSNFRGTSLSVVGKCRVVLGGRVCTDQIFIVRHICLKYLGKGKDVYFACLDLEKA